MTESAPSPPVDPEPAPAQGPEHGALHAPFWLHILVICWLAGLCVLGARSLVSRDARYGFSTFMPEVSYSLDYYWVYGKAGKKGYRQISYQPGEELKGDGNARLQPGRRRSSHDGTGSVLSWIQAYTHYMYEQHKPKQAIAFTAVVQHRIAGLSKDKLSMLGYPREIVETLPPPQVSKRGWLPKRRSKGRRYRKPSTTSGSTGASKGWRPPAGFGIGLPQNIRPGRSARSGSRKSGGLSVGAGLRLPKGALLKPVPKRKLLPTPSLVDADTPEPPSGTTGRKGADGKTGWRP